ncbi:MAG: BatD family protein [Saprospiraceae bacterium]
MVLSLSAQGPSVQANLNSAEILIGDEVVLTISISHEDGVRLKNIGLGALEELEKLEVKQINPADTASRSPYNIQQEIILTSFDSGVYQLPAIPLTFASNAGDQIVNTRPLQLTVIPYPVQLTDSTDIQPIKDIIKEQVGLEDALPYLLILVSLLLVGFGVWWLVKGRRRQKVETGPIVPQLKAHELALQKLETLEKEPWLSQGAYKTYQSELSYILREYFENRYGVNALEATTFDLLKHLQDLDIEDWYDQLKDLLQKSDLVKFAKAEYPIDFHESAFSLVKSFVEDTQEIPVDLEEEEEGESEENNATTES